MNFLNAQQLAFLLEIKKEDARIMMCNAWEKEKGISKIGHKIKGADIDKKTGKLVESKNLEYTARYERFI